MGNGLTLEITTRGRTAERTLVSQNHGSSAVCASYYAELPPLLCRSDKRMPSCCEHT
jgi:hypothetical protein